MAKVNFKCDRFECALREGTHTEERIFENHCHPEYELIAVLEGSVSMVVEGSRMVLRSAEAAIIPPFCYHSIYAEEKCNYKRITALFGEDMIPREISEDFLEKSASTLAVSHPTLSPILDSIRSTMMEDELPKYESYIWGCLVQILYVHTYRKSKKYAVDTDPRVKSITEYIDSHLCDRITLDELAEYLFVSKSTLCHIFREQMKISVKQYVLQKKLAYAARLISEGGSATSAAETVGYDNYANFYKVYKKTFGTSPRSVKKK